MKIYAAEEGSGPAVLLVHAFPLNRSMWAPQIRALSNRFRVITPDIRGFGNNPATSPWTLADACDDLAELLDELKVADCALVGLSMGGYIALPFYAKYPDRVRQLVLADTRARADNESEREGRTEMIVALGQFGAGMLADRMLPRLLRPNEGNEVVTTVRNIIDQASAGAAIHALMAMRDRPDSSTVLYRLSCPALVMAGEHDVITRVAECQDMAGMVANGRFVMIPDAGHLSNLENPEAFNSALNQF